MTSEHEEEEEQQQLAAQLVDVFVRSDDAAEWQLVGQGTVMWMPEGDRQRLMVLAEVERPLGSVILPSEHLRHTPDPAPNPASASTAQPSRSRLAPAVSQVRASTSASARRRP